MLKHVLELQIKVKKKYLLQILHLSVLVYIHCEVASSLRSSEVHIEIHKPICKQSP